MHWTEPASDEDSHADLEKRLWDAANKMWADAALKPSEFSQDQYSSLGRTMRARVHVHLLQNQNLRRTRDLLPKLLQSGY